MNSRERVLKALNFEKVDRTSVDMGGTSWRRLIGAYNIELSIVPLESSFWHC